MLPDNEFKRLRRRYSWTGEYAAEMLEIAQGTVVQIEQKRPGNVRGVYILALKQAKLDPNTRRTGTQRQFKDLLRSVDLTPRQLSQVLGVSPGHYHSLVSGRQGRIRAVYWLALTYLTHHVPPRKIINVSDLLNVNGKAKHHEVGACEL